MILSALFTSVGINLGLCVLLFALYSVLRKQPWNVRVYAARLVAEGKLQQRSRFDIVRLLPSAGWMRQAWLPSEDELLTLAGLDAVVFMRIFIFGMKVFSFAAIIGIFILLPINYEGDQLHIIDLADLANESLEKFSISNVQDGSKWLWAHFSAAYLLTAAVCYFLYFEYKYISSRRLAYFLTCKPQPHHFTVLVRGIPKAAGGSFSDSVENFFSEYHSSTYLSHSVVRQTSKLRHLINDAENVYRMLTRMKSKRQNPEVGQHGKFLGLFKRDVDPVGEFEKKLVHLEENVRLEQSDVSLTGVEVPAAFVCFRSRYGAAAAIHIQQTENPTMWVTEEAPEPYDVHWPFFSTSFIRRWISKLVVFVASIVLSVLFLIPVAFVQGLANLNKLEVLFPFLKGILSITFFSQIITGYLPSLILQLFLSLAPPIMIIFSTMQGYISYSEIEKSACRKMILFTTWNAFFAIVLSGSVASQAEVFLDPKNIPGRLAVAVPAQATFFITYVVTSGWTKLATELTRLKPLIGSFFGRLCCNRNGDEFQAPSLQYHKEIPSVLFFGLLGCSYFLLAPLILPFLLIYICFGYIIYRNQILNVYVSKYETAGKFWPIVHNSTIFALVLMQLITIGILGLKKLTMGSTLTVPLPILTLLFNEYCRKRFLPMFVAYSAESLIKKDREDENDPAMHSFLNNLATAYDDPALKPVRRSGGSGGRTFPLLFSEDN